MLTLTMRDTNDDEITIGPSETSEEYLEIRVEADTELFFLDVERAEWLRDRLTEWLRSR